MANHFGSLFYIRHEDENQIKRLADAIRNKSKIDEIWDIQFKEICVEYVRISEYELSDPNRIVLKFEFRRYLPFALFETLESSGFRILAHIYDLGGGIAWIYGNDEFIEIPNWLDTAESEPIDPSFDSRNPDSDYYKDFFDLNPHCDTCEKWPNFQ